MVLKYIVILVLLGSALGQTVCFQGTDTGLKEIPCDFIPKAKTVRTWTIEPAYEKPHRFTFLNEHPKRTLFLFMLMGGVAGGSYAWISRKHCDSYPKGETGFGINCSQVPGYKSW